MYDFIDYKINNDFPQNGDVLYDFERNSNLISIYYIKGAKRIEKISEKAKNIEVKPIQIIVKEVMMKILKNNIFNCKVLIKFNEHYYYISFKEGLFYYNYIEKDKEVNEKLKETDQMKWVSIMNNYKITAEEIAFKEWIEE